MCPIWQILSRHPLDQDLNEINTSNNIDYGLQYMYITWLVHVNKTCHQSKYMVNRPILDKMGIYAKKYHISEEHDILVVAA